MCEHVNWGEAFGGGEKTIKQTKTIFTGVVEESVQVVEAWAAPTLVVEMVASYQLGDRDRAIGVGDRLKAVSIS